MVIAYGDALTAQSNLLRFNQQELLMKQDYVVHRGCALRLIDPDGDVVAWGSNPNKYLRVNRKGPLALPLNSIDADADKIVVGGVVAVPDLYGVNNRLHVFDRDTGAIAWEAIEGSAAPVEVAIDGSGNVLAIGKVGNTSTLYEYDADGTLIQQTDIMTTAGRNAALVRPLNNDLIYVAWKSSTTSVDTLVADTWLSAARTALTNTTIPNLVRGVASNGEFAAAVGTAVRLYGTVLSWVDDDGSDLTSTTITFTVISGHTVQVGNTLRVHFDSSTSDRTVSAVTANTITVNGNATSTPRAISRAVHTATAAPLAFAVNDDSEIFTFQSVSTSPGFSYRIAKATVAAGLIWETELGTGTSNGVDNVQPRLIARPDGGAYAHYRNANSLPANNAWAQLWRLAAVDDAGNLEWNRAMGMRSSAPISAFAQTIKSLGNLRIDQADGESLAIAGAVWPPDQFCTTGIDY